MTGPEHYREAERLADRANHFTYGDGGDAAVGAALAAEAQVHATLALTAATGPHAEVRTEYGVRVTREDSAYTYGSDGGVPWTKFAAEAEANHVLNSTELDTDIDVVVVARTVSVSEWREVQS